MTKRIHAVARTRLLVAKMLGYAVQGTPRVAFKGLPARDAASPKRVMLAHGTTRTDNEWPVHRWLQLAGQLIASGYDIVLPDANERESIFCQCLKIQLLSLTPDARIDTLPRMNLSQLLDEMATCDGVIGVDSGLSHMAVALGLPHVQIFSQDRAWRAGPLPIAQGGVAHQMAVGGLHTPDVDEVWQAWLKVSQC
jgi:heptosyltransferase I